MFPSYTIDVKEQAKIDRFLQLLNTSGVAIRSIPENLVCMFSYWKGLPMDNPYNMPVFRCAMDNSEKIGFHCPGNCDFCKEHKCGCIYGNSSWVDLH